MVSVFILIILLVILLTIFVGRATELIIMKIQEKKHAACYAKKP